MDLALFGRYFLDFALLYPSAFLCLASLWEKLRTPRRTACIAAGCITLLCIGCAALCAVFGLNSNSLLPTAQYLIALAHLFHTTTDDILGLESQEQIVLRGMNEQEKRLVYDLVAYIAERKEESTQSQK